MIYDSDHSAFTLLIVANGIFRHFKQCGLVRLRTRIEIQTILQFEQKILI